MKFFRKKAPTPGDTLKQVIEAAKTVCDGRGSVMVIHVHDGLVSYAQSFATEDINADRSTMALLNAMEAIRIELLSNRDSGLVAANRK